MAILAIRGHETRSEEVIKILEMLGGNNKCGHSACFDNLYYFLDKSSNKIDYDWVKFLSTDTLIFTLEEFLEKFPYKVGDKVSSKCLKNYEVSKMEWESVNNRVIYKLQGMGWYSADELQPYKEETMEEPKELLIGFIKDKDGNWVLNTHKDYEIKEVDGKFMLLRKKPQYPETYEECCRIVNANPYVRLVYNLSDGQKYSYDEDNLRLYESIRKLLICRDAYWKIAGWKPNWKDFSTQKYSISVDKDKVILSQRVTGSRIFAFPTEEMRDAFYENFKDLIEECKELL